MNMEQILNLIKDNEQFKRYEELIRTYNDMPYDNMYKSLESYRTDPILALLECLKVERNNDELVVFIDNGIGRIENYEEQLGHATYRAVFTKDGKDLKCKGTIDANFTSADDSMFDGRSSRSAGPASINIPLLQETAVFTYEGMGYLLPANIDKQKIKSLF